MALIGTPYGDVVVGVQITDGLMVPAKIDFSLPLSHPLVQSGAFNLWQEVDVTLYDGDTEAGQQRGPAMQSVCYVTNPQRNDQSLNVELHDASIWLQRRDDLRPTALAQSAGMHVQDLFANILDNQERRLPQSFVPVDGTSSSLWNGGTGPTTGSAGASITAGASGVTLSLRQMLATGLRFTTSTTPTALKVHLITRADVNVTWANTLEVSVDGGSTWLASHAVPVNAANTDIWIDVFGDTTWTSAMLAPGLVVLRFTGVASSTDATQSWEINYLEFMVATASSTDTFPILTGSIDPGGPVITLPAGERKTLMDWFSWISDQSNYEWSVTLLQTVATNIPVFNWAQRIGVDVDVIQSVVVNGAGSEILSLEEGQLLSSPIQASIDGLALFTRVRVTAPGLADVTANNTMLQTLIGIHSTTIDLGTGATATDQANTAAQQLVTLASPAMHIQVTLPRIPALWGVLLNGNTVILNLKAAPVNRWQGMARIVGRVIDDNNGTMQLDLLTVQDLGSSSIAVGSGNGVPVQAPVNTRKSTPAMQRRRKFVWWIDLARRLARQ